jgi:parvulin-like peptidyl-prolyl isomerase
VPAFDKVAFSIPVKRVTDPVRTQYGWHVIEALTPVRAAATTPFKQVKQAIRQQLLQSKKNEASTKYVEKLEKSDDVNYQVGFAPRRTNTVSDS